MPATVTGWSDTQITSPCPAACRPARCSSKRSTEAPNGAVRRTGHHGRQRQAIDRHRDRHHRRQSADRMLPPGQTIQSAIDAATPGDLIIVPARHLQRNGADVEAGPAARCRCCLQRHQRQHPSGGQAGCLAPAGRLPVRLGARRHADHAAPIRAIRDSDTVRLPRHGHPAPQVDRLPLEATVGWDATLNGNLAELLQEPTLMGALEGAASRCWPRA